MSYAAWVVVVVVVDVVALARLGEVPHRMFAKLYPKPRATEDGHKQKGKDAAGSYAHAPA